MTRYTLLPQADCRIDEIYEYTLAAWGGVQAQRYLNGLLDRLEDVAARRIPWRAIAASFEVEGWFCRYEHHFIYWRMLADGRVGFVTILHERMSQMRLVQEAFES